MVSWFFVSKFLGFTVSWFVGFEVSKIYQISCLQYWSHIQDFRNLIRRICRCPSFRKFPKLCMFNILNFTKVMFLKTDPGIFLIFFRHPGVSKEKLVLGLRDTSKNPEIIEITSFGFSHKQIDVATWLSGDVATWHQGGRNKTPDPDNFLAN